MNGSYRKNVKISLFYSFFISLMLGIFMVSAVFAGGPQSLSPQVHEALRAMTVGKATHQQKALLFANNDAINKARLARQIPDAQYQVAQEHYKKLNQRFAKKAAKSAKADFEVQKSKSTRSQPGTDSDYITKVKSVQQVKDMQADYNRRVNKYLKKNKVITADRTDWHNKLDTDFMADPKGVSQAEFEKIADVNNDAYRRREAAAWEYKSRNSDAGPITQKETTQYVKEMEDFRNNKKKLIRDLQAKGGIKKGSLDEGKLIQKQAQQQKYDSRIGDADARYRQDHGLSQPDNPTHELAKTGAIREPDVTEQKAREILGKRPDEKLTDAEKKIAQKKFDAKRQAAFATEQNIHQNANRSAAKGVMEKAAARDAAQIMENMSPSEKGRFMAEVQDSLPKNSRTGDLTPESRKIMSDLKTEMRKYPGSKPGTKKVKGGGVLEAAGKVMVGSDILNTAQDVVDLYEGKKTVGEVVESAVINFTPQGQAYAVGKQVHEKASDYADAQSGVDAANKNIREAHNVDAALQARQEGATKEETAALLSALRSGDQAKAEQIAQDLRDRGVDYDIPTASDEYTTEADDTVLERTVQVAEGMKDQVVRAGKFVKNAAENLEEIGGSVVDIVEKEIHVVKEEIKHKKQAEDLYDRLVAKGADPDEARNAVTKFKEGDFAPLRNLRKEVQTKEQSQSEDDLVAAMAAEADSPQELAQWKDSGSRQSQLAEDLKNEFLDTDATGQTATERNDNDQLTLTQKGKDIQKDDLQDMMNKDQKIIKMDNARKATLYRNAQDAYASGWKTTMKDVNAVIAQLNKADAQKIKQKTQEAVALINQMKKGTISDADFTNKLKQLENEYGTLKQQGQAAWKKIVNQMVNGQLNNTKGNIGKGTGDAAADILSSVPADKIDQRSIVCDTTSKSGNNTPASISVDMKGGTGTAQLKYSLYSVKDRIVVQVNGATVKDTGCTNGSATIPIQVSGGDQVRVVIQPACEGSSTSWNFSVSCPQ